ncbi:Smr/MutS family protein [Skermanella mucosa]|uniref:Smr/MutS family protein n=1 Tax=Skermanella mucosa TaxID=1789672 RepID=UPI00192A9D81|nr:Smr/MutS family protein [Skermanella mucosa]UEM21017.1 Smr/MutS family protein [Skermanella mucosa]
MNRTPPRRRRTVTSDEHSLWRMAMRDTDPLPGREIPDPPAPSPAAGDLPVEIAGPAVPDGLAGRGAGLPASGHRNRLPALDPASPPGLDRRTDDRLRRGRLGIEGRIDLHGMTQSQAHAALNSFILRGWHEQRRMVLVITGKGSAGKGSGGQGAGILRQVVPRWLNESPLRPLVLAIQRAQPKDGGDGALYVLLKRRR